MEKTISVVFEDKKVDVIMGEITWKDKKNSIKEAKIGRASCRERV